MCYVGEGDQLHRLEEGALFEKTVVFPVKIGTHALFNNDLWVLHQTFDIVIKDQIFFHAILIS